MATAFKVNSPVPTPTNFVDVVNNLSVGTHTFQLEVVDDQGNHSKPVQARVVVVGTTGPGPVVGPGPVIGGPIGPGLVIKP